MHARALIFLSLAAVAPLHAQAPTRIAPPTPASLGAPIRAHAAAPLTAWSLPAVRQASSGRILAGAVIGAVAGVVACTAISNIAESEGGFHSCTTKGNLVFGVSGALLGAAVAHLTRK